MKWLGRFLSSEPEEPRATNAQIGYIVSLMNELDVDTLEVVTSDGGRVKVKLDQVPLLRKGDASQVITQLIKAKENR
jgi:hypothetical protein